MDLTHDEIAEQAFGILVAAQQDGITDPNIIAHAIARNVLVVAGEQACERLHADA